MRPDTEQRLAGILAELTYGDTCNSWRRSVSPDDGGSDEWIPSTDAVLEERPCGIRKSPPAALGQKENAQAIDYDALLCIDVEADIAPGDKVEVTLMDGTVETYLAGERTPYGDHAEVQLTRHKGVA